MAHSDLLSPDEASWLSEAVRKANGKLVLVVTPWDSAPSTRFEKVYHKMVSQAKTPVIILESHKHIEELKAEFKSKGMPIPVILPTGEENPFLFTGGRRPADQEQNDLAHILRGLGVREVKLGGAFSQRFADSAEATPRGTINYEEIAKHEEKLRQRVGLDTVNYAELITHGCVGFTYRNLISHGFGVRLISPMLWPTKPEYWRRLQQRPGQKFERRPLEQLHEHKKEVPRKFA